MPVYIRELIALDAGIVRDNGDCLLPVAPTHPFKLNIAFNNGEDGVVSADVCAFARMKFCAVLANDDVTRDNMLAAKNLHAEALAVAITTIS